MKITVLHLNMERSKHISAVYTLIQQRQPDVVCLAEAMHGDVLRLSLELGYELAFAPLLILDNKNGSDEQGSAILSRYKICDTQNHRYDDDRGALPHFSTDGLESKNGERPETRFLYHYTLLSVQIEPDAEHRVTVSTTHFPIVDHTAPGHSDHEIASMRNITDLEHVRVHMDRLLGILQTIPAPHIFTSDLNNPRGEYFYDLLAHELVDQVPPSLDSSIDPKNHRAKNLKMVVDTIMTSPDI